MRGLPLAIGLAGVVVTLVLIGSLDLGQITAGFAAVGWLGALALVLCRLASIALCGWALFALEPMGIVSLVSCLVARLVRDGVSNLLAIVPAVGEIVGARMLTLAGNHPAMATAVTVADLTMEIVSQAAFTVLGAAALMAAWPGESANQMAFAAVGLSLLLVAGLFLAQHPRMLGWLEGLARRLAREAKWSEWGGDDGFTSILAGIYRRRLALAGGFSLHFAGWLVGCFETWAALALMGQPLPMLHVLALQAAVFAARSVAFMVPWGAGVQEGSFLVVGTVLGLSPEAAMTLSLVKRLVEVAVSVPGLVLWHRVEARSDPSIIAKPGR